MLDPASLQQVGTFDGFTDGAYVDWGGLDSSADGSHLAVIAWRNETPVEVLVWETDRPAEPGSASRCLERSTAGSS